MDVGGKDITISRNAFPLFSNVNTFIFLYTSLKENLDIPPLPEDVMKVINE